jgi:hypothetical protein
MEAPGITQLFKRRKELGFAIPAIKGRILANQN